MKEKDKKSNKRTWRDQAGRNLEICMAGTWEEVTVPSSLVGPQDVRKTLIILVVRPLSQQGHPSELVSTYLSLGRLSLRPPHSDRTRTCPPKRIEGLEKHFLTVRIDTASERIGATFIILEESCGLDEICLVLLKKAGGERKTLELTGLLQDKGRIL